MTPPDRDRCPEREAWLLSEAGLSMLAHTIERQGYISLSEGDKDCLEDCLSAALEFTLDLAPVPDRDTDLNGEAPVAALDRNQARAIASLIEGNAWHRIPIETWTLLRDSVGPWLRKAADRDTGEGEPRPWKASYLSMRDQRDDALARLERATEIIRECDSPDGFCGEMPDETRDRIEEFLKTSGEGAGTSNGPIDEQGQAACRPSPVAPAGLEAAVDAAYEESEGRTTREALSDGDVPGPRVRAIRKMLTAARPHLVKAERDRITAEITRTLTNHGALEKHIRAALAVVNNTTEGED